MDVNEERVKEAFSTYGDIMTVLYYKKYNYKLNNNNNNNIYNKIV